MAGRSERRRKQSQIEKIRNRALIAGKVDLSTLPQPLRCDDSKRLVRVFVEGYEDVAFWRGIFDHFTNPYLRFEISVPTRDDLPKGKKVLLSMAGSAGDDLLLCMDSDFDYIFGDVDEQSREIISSPYMFHTYAYATENYLCYAPSLHNVCVKVTKNDTRIFDFEKFMAEYSRTIYPLFLWYAFSAQRSTENVFTLADFRQSVRIGYLDLEENGDRTIAWLRRNVEKREQLLRQRNAKMIEPMREFEEQLRARGLKPENTYLFMHGHTLMDNVVMVLLNTVCEKLREMSIARITASEKRGVALKNEMSNYTNSLRSIRDVLLDNENYTTCPLYRRLQRDIERYIATGEPLEVAGSFTLEGFGGAFIDGIEGDPHGIIGLTYAVVFGVIIALSGCYQGIRCGRSAQAVGKATTTAVVHGIVGIIVATAIITVLCNVLKV